MDNSRLLAYTLAWIVPLVALLCILAYMLWRRGQKRRKQREVDAVAEEAYRQRSLQWQQQQQQQSYMPEVQGQLIAEVAGDTRGPGELDAVDTRSHPQGGYYQPVTQPNVYGNVYSQPQQQGNLYTAERGQYDPAYTKSAGVRSAWK